MDFSLADYPILDLSGEIRAGDAELLAKFFSLNEIRIVRIDSAGGDVAEAIRMAALIKGSHIPVGVRPRGGICASSCFFLYLAADSRLAVSANSNGKLPSDWKTHGGFVGIHRPYVKFSGSNTNLTIERQERATRETEKYLRAQRLPQHLIDEMLSRPSNDIYWLTGKDLATIGEHSAGYSEALVAKCGYMTNSRLSEKNWSTEQENAYIERLTDCQIDLWNRERLPLAKQFYAKLKTGWRPWNK